MNNKSYPDNHHLRHQSKAACDAIKRLTNMGIKLINVNFRSTNPLIEIEHCPSNIRIKSALGGQGFNSKTGKFYFTRKACLSGCEINWQEERA